MVAPLVPVPDPRGDDAFAIARAALSDLRGIAESIAAARGPGTAAVTIRIETCGTGTAGAADGFSVALAAPSDARPLPLVRSGAAASAAVQLRPGADAACP
ncbi:hypothetical protein [Jannaschia ovalis]|uniref:Uncharacterized protein n=1 Tax=Jannaschia ovalis TaxID=3038773 RepID=A0ABY8L8Q4_9RHOB|nr:hypothetical protein [Jannaschia sp. GRR-S6-38]WGH77739.1 hypothetical protein P8627_11930 [Jannaschia sp. GRR-S6-38]